MQRPVRTRVSIRLTAGLLATGLAGALTACGSSSAKTATTNPTRDTQAAAASINQQPPVFEIDAAEGMHYALPTTHAPAGLVRVTLVNHDDDMPHQAQLFLLHPNVTMDQFKTTLLSPGGLGAALALADPAGGPDAVGPGHSTSVFAHLSPGATYAVICTVPGSDGTPHYQHGMIASFTTAAASNAAAAPTASGTVTLLDDKFQVPASMDWSRPITVTNHGHDPHEMQILGPAPGKTVQDVKQYLMAPPGSVHAPPPYRAFGGVATIAPGGSQETQLQLPAGPYLLVCFVPDSKTHMPHFLMGMISEITVS